MFSKILGKSNDSSSDENHENKVLIARIAKMNLTEMKQYISNRIPDLPVNEQGLIEIMNKLLEVNKKTSQRYVNIDDMDSKIKKGFDLILSLLTNKKITVTAIELVNEFLEKSKDIVEKYDKDNKQIYYSKFRDSITLAIDNMNKVSEFQRKSNLIGE